MRSLSNLLPTISKRKKVEGGIVKYFILLIIASCCLKGVRSDFLDYNSDHFYDCSGDKSYSESEE